MPLLLASRKQVFLSCFAFINKNISCTSTLKNAIIKTNNEKQIFLTEIFKIILKSSSSFSPYKKIKLEIISWTIQAKKKKKKIPNLLFVFFA